MARKDFGVVGQCEKSRLNGLDDLFVIASGQVGAPNASGEESVSGQDHFEGREMETD